MTPLVDVNLLIYAVNESAPLHKRAKKWLEQALSGSQTVGLPWIVLLAFIRLSTRPGIFQRPLPVEAAFDIVGAWLSQPSVVVIHPGPRHFLPSSGATLFFDRTVLSLRDRPNVFYV